MKAKWKDILFGIVIIIILIVFGVLMYNIFTTDSSKGDITGIPTVIPTATPKPTFETPENQSGGTQVKPTVTPRPTANPLVTPSGLGGNTSSGDSGTAGEYKNESEEIADTGEEIIDFTEVKPNTGGGSGYKIIHKFVNSYTDRGQSYEIRPEGVEGYAIVSEAEQISYDKWREKALRNLGLSAYFDYCKQKIGLSPMLTATGLANPSSYFYDEEDHTITDFYQLTADGDLSTKAGKVLILAVKDISTTPNTYEVYTYSLCHGTAIATTVKGVENINEAKEVIRKIYEECITSR